MLKFRFLACFCLVLVFGFITGISVSAQNLLDNKPSDKDVGASSEKKETDEKTDDTDTDPKKIEGRSFQLKRGARDIEIVPAFAPIQPVFFSGHKEYNTDGRRFSMINVRFTRT